MIIDNVKVYTPDQKFVEGGLVLDQDSFENITVRSGVQPE